MGIFAIVGLSAAPIFFGFLMEPWLPLGHWGWGLALFFALLPSAIYWRKKIFSRVRNIGQRAKKKPLKTAAEEITGDGKEVAKPIKKSGPNWTMPELIQHMYNAGNDLSRCIDEIHDKARLEQLSMWGRKYSAASPHENPNPLRPIPALHWDHYCLDTLQCAYAEDATASCTEPRSSSFSEHDYNGTFQDLRVNRSQAMALWPSNEGEET